MKLVVLLICLLGTAAVAGPLAPTVKKDKFDDSVTATSPILILDLAQGEGTHAIMFIAGAELKAKKKDDADAKPGDRAFAIVVMSRSREWLYLRQRHDLQLKLIVGDEKVKLDQLTNETDVGRSGGVSEVFCFDVPRPWVEKIANGTAIEGKMGQAEFKLKPGHMKAMRLVAEAAGILTPNPQVKPADLDQARVNARAAAREAEFAMSTAKAEIAAAVDGSPAIKKLADDVATKAAELEKIRATGSPYEKLNASSAYTSAKGNLDRARTAALSAGSAKLTEATKEFAKAAAEVQSIEARIKALSGDDNEGADLLFR